MSKYCISNSQILNEIRKEVKNSKSNGFLPRKQLLDFPKNVIFGHLNINLLQNKFDSISELIKLSNKQTQARSAPSKQSICYDLLYMIGGGGGRGGAFCRVVSSK